MGIAVPNASNTSPMSLSLVESYFKDVVGFLTIFHVVQRWATCGCLAKYGLYYLQGAFEVRQSHTISKANLWHPDKSATEQRMAQKKTKVQKIKCILLRKWLASLLADVIQQRKLLTLIFTRIGSLVCHFFSSLNYRSESEPQWLTIIFNFQETTLSG